MALNEFEGTVMLVSHDRALLRAVCDEFWMVGRGKVEPFDGDLDDYQKYLLEESKRLREEAQKLACNANLSVSPTAVQAPVPVASSVAAPLASVSAPVISGAEQRKLDAQKRQQLAEKTRPLKRELEQNEQRLASIEVEKALLEQQMTSIFPPAKIAETGRRLKALTEEASDLEERWLELTSLLEEVTSI
jgi:ATP-binding cassette subfamily F protein 3